MTALNRFSRYFALRLVNGGTVLVVMGAGWLYLWLFPWYVSYVVDPQWGHNYAEAAAFLVLGITYFNRRIIPCTLAFIASLLVIPASLELVPHSITAFTSAGILVLVVVDMVIERGRKNDLGQPSNQRLTFWLKKHLPRFSYIMLAHIAFIYFLVRIPAGTYETDLVTRVFDGMVIPLVLLLLMEDMTGIVNRVFAERTAFFWGLLATIVPLAILAPQPENIPIMAIAVIVAMLGIISLLTSKPDDAKEPSTTPDPQAEK